MNTGAGAVTPIAYSLAPMLLVRNGAQAVEFYTAFGAIGRAVTQTPVKLALPEKTCG